MPVELDSLLERLNKLSPVEREVMLVRWEQALNWDNENNASVKDYLDITTANVLIRAKILTMGELSKLYQAYLESRGYLPVRGLGEDRWGKIKDALVRLYGAEKFNLEPEQVLDEEYNLANLVSVRVYNVLYRYNISNLETLHDFYLRHPIDGHYILKGMGPAMWEEVKRVLARFYSDI